MDLQQLHLLANTSLLTAKSVGYDDQANQTDPNVVQENLICPVSNCDRRFASKRNLMDHYRGHHQGSKPHHCQFPGCGKSFLRPAHLTIHTRIHTGEKPFICGYPGCNKTWNQKSALKQHLRSHTGEKPFQCSFSGCGKRFSTSSSCKRHANTHEKLDLQNVNNNSTLTKRKHVEEQIELLRLPNKRQVFSTYNNHNNNSIMSSDTATSTCSSSSSSSSSLVDSEEDISSDSSNSSPSYSFVHNDEDSNNNKQLVPCFVEQLPTCSSSVSSIIKMSVNFLIN